MRCGWLDGCLSVVARVFGAAVFLDTLSEFRFGRSTNTLTEGKSDVFNVEKFMDSLQSAFQACRTRIFMSKFSWLMSWGYSLKKSCKQRGY